MLGGGGGIKCFGVVLTWELEVLAILKVAEKVSTLSKGGHEKCLEGGGRKRFRPAAATFPFCSPRPVINDRSLTTCMTSDEGMPNKITHQQCGRHILCKIEKALDKNELHKTSLFRVRSTQ